MGYGTDGGEEVLNEVEGRGRGGWRGGDDGGGGTNKASRVRHCTDDDRRR